MKTMIIQLLSQGKFELTAYKNSVIYKVDEIPIKEQIVADLMNKKRMFLRNDSVIKDFPFEENEPSKILYVLRRSNVIDLKDISSDIYQPWTVKKTSVVRIWYHVIGNSGEISKRLSTLKSVSNGDQYLWINEVNHPRIADFSRKIYGIYLKEERATRLSSDVLIAYSHKGAAIKLVPHMNVKRI